MTARFGNIKVKRWARLYIKEAAKCVVSPISDPQQWLGVGGLIIASYAAIQSGARSAVIQQVHALNDWGRAILYAVPLWIFISLIRAFFATRTAAKEKGVWHQNEFVYLNPQLVAVSIFSADDAHKAALVTVDDAEPNSMVSYSIELYPPVQARASFYLERAPGQLDGIFRSIMVINSGGGPPSPAKQGGRGSVRLSGRKAYLRVKLDPETVQVTARVYIHSFDATVIPGTV